MPRSFNRNSRKSTPSSSSKKDKKRKQANSTNDLDQRIDEGEMVEDGVDTMSTPTHSAAPAASLLSPADTSPTDANEPIAKLKAFIDGKRPTSSTSQDEVPLTTPIQNNNLTEVTFKSDPIATSIASRRRRSRKARLGRTSRALSRDEQLMIQWEDPGTNN